MSNSFELNSWKACYIILTVELLEPYFKRYYCRATLRGKTIQDSLRGILQAQRNDLNGDPVANRDWMSASVLK